jgi:molybdopterin-guanine dinucleotide biosynthesis protein A
MKRSIDISAFILAGGKSSRMGTDKGLLPFRGKPMVQHVIGVLQQHFRSVSIISNASGYTKFGLPVVNDMLKDKGPLGGIYTGLEQSRTEWNFFCACDMPFLDLSVLEMMTAFPYSTDAVVAKYYHHMEPLCACYNKSCLPVILEMNAAGNYKLHDLLSNLQVKAIDFSGVFESAFNPFRNLNTMEEVNLFAKDEN